MRGLWITWSKLIITEDIFIMGEKFLVYDHL